MTSPRGHRLVARRDDLVLDAWGPTREACFEEAVAGLVEAGAAPLDRATAEAVPIAVGPAPDVELLRQLLEEVADLVDVFGVVPARAELEPAEDGGVAGYLEVVPVGRRDAGHRAPRTAARRDLDVGEDGRGWRARTTIVR